MMNSEQVPTCCRMGMAYSNSLRSLLRHGIVSLQSVFPKVSPAYGRFLLSGLHCINAMRKIFKLSYPISLLSIYSSFGGDNCLLF